MSYHHREVDHAGQDERHVSTFANFGDVGRKEGRIHDEKSAAGDPRTQRTAIDRNQNAMTGPDAWPAGAARIGRAVHSTIKTMMVQGGWKIKQLAL
jgi:hypothetical protein